MSLMATLRLRQSRKSPKVNLCNNDETEDFIGNNYVNERGSLFIMIFSIDIEFNSLLISDDLKKFGNFQNSRISYNFCIKTIKQKR